MRKLFALFLLAISNQIFAETTSSTPVLVTKQAVTEEAKRPILSSPMKPSSKAPRKKLSKTDRLGYFR